MKKPLRVAVIGAAGRMGREIQNALATHPGCEPRVGVVLEGQAPGFAFTANGLDPRLLAETDVWIDFSTLENFPKTLKAAARMKKPLVTGVTGLKTAHFNRIREAGRSIPVLWSPNMSFGIAALRKALAVTRDLLDFDFQIEEFHHRHKKDKPSGTALYLQEELERRIGRRAPEALAVRGGGIFGVHKVWMMSDEEVLCFEHQALNRAVFAKGAVKAAVWLARRKKGVYTMDDLFSGEK